MNTFYLAVLFVISIKYAQLSQSNDWNNNMLPCPNAYPGRKYSDFLDLAKCSERCDVTCSSTIKARLVTSDQLVCYESEMAAHGKWKPKPNYQGYTYGSCSCGVTNGTIYRKCKLDSKIPYYASIDEENCTAYCSRVKALTYRNTRNHKKKMVDERSFLNIALCIFPSETDSEISKELRVYRTRGICYKEESTRFIGHQFSYCHCGLLKNAVDNNFYQDDNRGEDPLQRNHNKSSSNRKMRRVRICQEPWIPLRWENTSENKCDRRCAATCEARQGTAFAGEGGRVTCFDNVQREADYRWKNGLCSCGSILGIRTRKFNHCVPAIEFDSPSAQFCKSQCRLYKVLTVTFWRISYVSGCVLDDQTLPTRPNLTGICHKLPSDHANKDLRNTLVCSCGLRASDGIKKNKPKPSRAIGNRPLRSNKRTQTQNLSNEKKPRKTQITELFAKTRVVESYSFNDDYMREGTNQGKTEITLLNQKTTRMSRDKNEFNLESKINNRELDLNEPHIPPRSNINENKSDLDLNEPRVPPRSNINGNKSELDLRERRTPPRSNVNGNNPNVTHFHTDSNTPSSSKNTPEKLSELITKKNCSKLSVSFKIPTTSVAARNVANRLQIIIPTKKDEVAFARASAKPTAKDRPLAKEKYVAMATPMVPTDKDGTKGPIADTTIGEATTFVASAAPANALVAPKISSLIERNTKRAIVFKTFSDKKVVSVPLPTKTADIISRAKENIVNSTSDDKLSKSIETSSEIRDIFRYPLTNSGDEVDPFLSDAFLPKVKNKRGLLPTEEVLKYYD